jgi:hypothetical protein
MGCSGGEVNTLETLDQLKTTSYHSMLEGGGLVEAYHANFVRRSIIMTAYMRKALLYAVVKKKRKEKLKGTVVCFFALIVLQGVGWGGVGLTCFVA